MSAISSDVLPMFCARQDRGAVEPEHWAFGVPVGLLQRRDRRAMFACSRSPLGGAAWLH